MAGWYNRGKTQLAGGSTIYSSDTIKALLVSQSYTFSADHNTLSDITHEITGGGYARQTLGSKTISQDDTNDRAAYDAADITFSNLTFTAITGVVIFKDTGTPSTSMLLWYCDFASTSPSAADVTISWNPTGIANIS